MLLIMWKRALVLSVCFFGLSYGISDGNFTNFCPTLDLIAPCTCIVPYYHIVCKDLEGEDVLRKVITNLKGIEHQFSKFKLLNFEFEYLPKEVFELENFDELYIENVKLHKLFDSPPSSDGAYKTVKLINVRILRGLAWEGFNRMTELKSIFLDFVPVPIMGEEFNMYVPHKLQQIEFVNARTRRFGTGVFKNYKDLEMIMFHNCRMENIERGHFPTPFNVQTMLFSFNRLTSIPADLFTQMPKLKILVLTGNQIATVPESAFGGNFQQIEMFMIAENPLKCDCSLKWIVKRKPVWLSGKCASPKSMHGKELATLTEQDFHC